MPTSEVAGGQKEVGPGEMLSFSDRASPFGGRPDCLGQSHSSVRVSRRPLAADGALCERIQAVHLPSTWSPGLLCASQLRPGWPAAPKGNHLWLLPSGPDQVHGASPRRTRSSTPL